MWPFKRKPEPAAPHTARYAYFFHELSEADRAAISGMGVGAASYLSVKQQRQRAQREKKMKLIPGKYYETADGVFQAKVGWVHNTVSLNDILYEKDFDASCSEAHPVVIREVAPPLKLEVGALYALSDGSVEWCESITGWNGLRLGSYWYGFDGTPKNEKNPRILHRIKLNEKPEASSGEKFQEAVKKAGARMSAVRGAIINDLIDSGYLAPYQIYESQMACPEEPIPVTYHPHSDCTKREVVVPEGYEDVNSRPGCVADRSELLMPHRGQWVPFDIHRVRANAPVIRPKPAPFKIDGAGWYRYTHGWVKLTQAELRTVSPSLLRRKATDEVAEILDAL